MQHAISPRVLGARVAPIDALVDRMRELPSLPEAALEALHLLEDPNYDVRAVADAVSRDPVLAMRIVGMGNSPFFGMGMRTSCVKTSILRLGERETRSAILSVAIMTTFPTLPAPLDVQRFWTFGLASAICARRLAEDLGYPDTSGAYLGALVHRLGDAFLAISFPRRFEEVWCDSRGGQGDLEEALNKEFGFYPGELCARVMESWNMPPRVAQAVRECRRPELAVQQPMLALVLWTSGWVATEVGLGLDPPEDDRNLWDGGLTQNMRRELHELGYAATLDYLLSGGDFVQNVRQLGRLVAGRPGPLTRARARARARRARLDRALS